MNKTQTGGRKGSNKQQPLSEQSLLKDTDEALTILLNTSTPSTPIPNNKSNQQSCGLGKKTKNADQVIRIRDYAWRIANSCQMLRQTRAMFDSPGNFSKNLVTRNLTLI